MGAIPHGRDLTACAMTAETIAKALGGRKAGGSWTASPDRSTAWRRSSMPCTDDCRS